MSNGEAKNKEMNPMQPPFFQTLTGQAVAKWLFCGGLKLPKQLHPHCGHSYCGNYYWCKEQAYLDNFGTIEFLRKRGLTYSGDNVIGGDDYELKWPRYVECAKLSLFLCICLSNHEICDVFCFRFFVCLCVCNAL